MSLYQMPLDDSLRCSVIIIPLYRHSARSLCHSAIEAHINEDPSRILVRALAGFGGFLWALVGFGGFCWGLSSFGGFYRVLSGLSGSAGRKLSKKDPNKPASRPLTCDTDRTKARTPTFRLTFGCSRRALPGPNNNKNRPRLKFMVLFASPEKR